MGQLRRPGKSPGRGRESYTTVAGDAFAKAGGKKPTTIRNDVAPSRSGRFTGFSAHSHHRREQFCKTTQTGALQEMAFAGCIS